jgi:hypothetical protein
LSTSEEHKALLEGITDSKVKLVLALLLERTVTMEMEIASLKRDQGRAKPTSSGGPSIG